MQQMHDISVQSDEKTLKKYSERPLLNYTKQEWKLPLGFLLSMTLCGLNFYPALLLVIGTLVYAFKHDRYSFVIMLTIFFGGFAFTASKWLVLPTSDFALVLAVVLAFLYKKNKAEKRTLWCILGYAASLIVLATYSLESMSVQMISIRNYLGFIYFIVPIACFAGMQFDINIFFRKIILFGLLVSAFYVIDTFILGGNILIPHTFAWGVPPSTFDHLRMHPLSPLGRKYPVGMYITMLSVYPIARHYRLTKVQWAILILGLFSTKTFSLISGFVVIYILCIGKIKTLIKCLIIVVIAAVSLYFVDGWLPVSNKSKSLNNETPLRIKSSVDQFISLSEAVDAEDIAQFASGRMAQILPKVELVMHEKRQWTGLGFLHPDYTKITRYIIHNEYYSDETQAEELAFEVENVPVQVFLTIGYIGLAIHILFFVLLCLIVRRKQDAMYFISVLLLCFWGGMGGFSNLNNFYGLSLCSLAYGIVLLQGRRREKENNKQRVHRKSAFER